MSWLQMLIAMAGSLSGYNGSFPFDKPGDPYGENVYIGMRFVSTVNWTVNFTNNNSLNIDINIDYQ